MGSNPTGPIVHAAHITGRRRPPDPPTERRLTAPYPLELAPIVLPKVWGGRRLATLGIDLPADDRFGEAWMLADLATTSASGAGGQAVVSEIRNGAFAGRPLGAARTAWARELGGDATRSFPVLGKLLDAREHLSVQVHPSRAYAAAHPDAYLKTECWFVLAADPGAELLLGMQDGVTTADIRAAVTAGTLPSLMHRIPAEVGACYLLPSGIIHALGAGVLVAEVQTASDTTYRLYDWTAEYARPERALHVDVSLEACDLSLRPIIARRPAGAWRGVVAATEYFTVTEVVIAPGQEIPLLDCTGSVDETAIIGLDGTIVVPGRVGGWATATASPAQSLLIPEVCTGQAVLHSATSARALIVQLPSRIN